MVAPMSPSPRMTPPKLTQVPGDLLRIVAPLHEGVAIYAQVCCASLPFS